VVTRFAHSLLAWTCLLLLGAASFLRPGMVLCISDHGHVRIELNCNSACETLCAESCEPAPPSLATASGAHNDCRDVPIELDPTSLTRADKGVPQFAAHPEIPVAVLEVPLALTLSCEPGFSVSESVPRPPAALSRLRVIVLQV